MIFFHFYKNFIFSASSIAPITERVGLIGSLHRGLHAFRIESEYKIETHSLKNEGSFTDLVYFKSLDVAYAYESKSHRIWRIKDPSTIISNITTKLDIKETISATSTTLDHRVFTKMTQSSILDPESHIYIQTKSSQVTCFKINENTLKLKKHFVVNFMPNKRFVDFLPLNSQSLIFLSPSGIISLFKIKDDGSRACIVREYCLENNSISLYYNGISRSNSEDYFVVSASESSKNEKMKRLVLMRLDPDKFYFQRKFILEFGEAQNLVAKPQDSKLYFYSRQEDEESKLYLMQNVSGKHNMTVFNIQDSKIEELFTIHEFQERKRTDWKVFNDCLWCLDCSGNVRVIGIVQDCAIGESRILATKRPPLTELGGFSSNKV